MRLNSSQRREGEIVGLQSGMQFSPGVPCCEAQRLLNKAALLAILVMLRVLLLTLDARNLTPDCDCRCDAGSCARVVILLLGGMTETWAIRLSWIWSLCWKVSTQTTAGQVNNTTLQLGQRHSQMVRTAQEISCCQVHAGCVTS